MRHRQTKEAANRYVQPTATAPHLDSTIAFGCIPHMLLASIKTAINRWTKHNRLSQKWLSPQCGVAKVLPLQLARIAIAHDWIGRGHTLSVTP